MKNTKKNLKGQSKLVKTSILFGDRIDAKNSGKRIDSKN
jgi:hypothetical protein